VALPLVQAIRTDDRHTLVRHDVPGRDAGVVQRMGRAPTRFWLVAVLAGPGARDELTTLREAFGERRPLSFVADVARGLPAAMVRIRDLRARELAGKPERFEVQLLLVEHVEPPAATAPVALDAAGPFGELVGALDAMGGLPDLSDPTPPLLGLVDELAAATAGLATALAGVSERTGTAGP
jgi:hypothetical protein